MNFGKEALVVLGSLVGLIIALTLISGGSLNLGTSPAGPIFNLGYKGPQNK
jgi:hypothetical protein